MIWRSQALASKSRNHLRKAASSVGESTWIACRIFLILSMVTFYDLVTVKKAIDMGRTLCSPSVQGEHKVRYGTTSFEENWYKHNHYGFMYLM